MKIQTFSVVVGGKKCNLTCPYCVAKMTGKEDCTETINERNFHKACEFAKQSGVSTVLLTGKGEPTLYHGHIFHYLDMIKDYKFPFIELQTNGIELQRLDSLGYVQSWYDMGVTTVSLSCVSYSVDKNKEILGDKFVDLQTNKDLLHKRGLSVRISCVMVKGGVDSVESVIYFTNRCKVWGVEQFTVRPVGVAEGSDTDIEKWTKEHEIPVETIRNIENYFEYNATLLLKLSHGAKVYDYFGQNISINSCLTHSPDPDDIRQLIFFPDGHLRYSWVYSGAIII